PLHVAPDLAVELLDEIEHVVALGERHLEIELRELELPVGPLRLVAEAARDLVVALEPAHHVELLEELRALREGVERAGRQAGGSTSNAEQRISIWPVAMRGLTFAGSRRTTSPSTRTTDSTRVACTAANRPGSTTTWTSPEASRRSTNASPP